MVREVSRADAAPYLSFKTFLAALEAFTTHGVPPLVDRGIWSTQPGGTQGLIMSALRFFVLIDHDNRPTNHLEEFASTPDNDRPRIIREMLERGYADLVQQDLTKMTAKMLDDAIQRYGISGQTKKKAITFFLQAAKFSELPLSSYLVTQIRNTSGNRRRRVANDRNKENVEEQGISASDAVLSSQGSSKTIQLSDGGTLTLNVSVDVFALSPEDRTFVFDLIDRLRGYESSKVTVQKNVEEHAL